jgi:uncharacterized protein (DUF433 family)
MITCDPRIRSGWPCIAGTRIGIECVAEDIAAGETIEQYAADKQVTVEQVKAALAVYDGMRPLFEALDDRESIVSYLERMAVKQQGYADKAGANLIYRGRLSMRAFMARALAKRVARREDKEA